MVEKYKNYLMVNGLSNSTIMNYILRIRKFLKKVKLEEINEDNISKFLLSLREEYSPSTINGYRDTIKSFLVFLKKDITIPQHLKLDRKLPDSITEEFLRKEIMPVIEAIFVNPLKIKTIFYFMFYTGIRVSEVVKLKRENFDFNKRTAKVYIKKTKEERLIVYTKEVNHLLDIYFSSEPEEENAFNIKLQALKKTFARLKPYFKNVNIYPHLLRHCVSEDTEILTEKGWKKYQTLKKGEKVFDYNLKTNKIQLTPLLDIYKYNYNGKMYNIKNHYLDCLISPEHRNIFKIAKQKQVKYKRQTQWRKWQLKTISELLEIPNKRLIKTLLSGQYNGHISIGKTKASILGWIMTDGHITKRDKNIMIGQSFSANANKCQIIEELLKRSKLQYSKKIQKPTRNLFTLKPSQMIVFRIFSKSCSWIYEFLNYDRTPKYKLFHLKKEELKSIHEAMMLGDGSKGVEFTTQNKKIIDFFRILTVLIGYRTFLKWSKLEHKFRTYLTYKNNCNILSKAIKKVDYKGIIWCPSTQNKTWIAKRNDKIFITGNSFATMLINKGVDVSIVSKLLGHKSIQSTMRYLNLDIRLVKEIYDKKVK